MSGKARPLLSCPLVAVTGQGRRGWNRGNDRGGGGWKRREVSRARLYTVVTPASLIISTPRFASNGYITGFHCLTVNFCGVRPLRASNSRGTRAVLLSSPSMQLFQENSIARDSSRDLRGSIFSYSRKAKVVCIPVVSIEIVTFFQHLCFFFYRNEKIVKRHDNK